MPLRDSDRKLNEALEPLLAVIRQEIDLLVSVYTRAGMVQDLAIRMQEQCGCCKRSQVTSWSQSNADDLHSVISMDRAMIMLISSDSFSSPSPISLVIILIRFCICSILLHYGDCLDFKIPMLSRIIQLPALSLNHEVNMHTNGGISALFPRHSQLSLLGISNITKEFYNQPLQL